MWIDTHCHFDAPEFDFVIAGSPCKRDDLRAAAIAVGVVHLVIPAVQRTHWREVIALAHRYGDSYALGIHPLFTPQAQQEDIAMLRQMLRAHRDDPHLVAVGEIGLDFFVPGLDTARQIWFYTQQLQLAREFGLPVILHVRKSSDWLLKTLRVTPVIGGIAHAFNGSLQQAQAFMALGFQLGFGGAVTFGRARKLRELATVLPLDRMVLETDAPDMPPCWLYTPAQQRASGLVQPPNTPAQLPCIAAEIAQLRNIPLDALAAATASNARFVLRGLPAMPPLQFDQHQQR